jgi:hypothetical protein
MTEHVVCCRWTGAYGEERYGLFPATFVKILSKEQSKRLKTVTNVKRTCGRKRKIWWLWLTRCSLKQSECSTW